ncbi:hypothetical protein PYW08_014055 [Mythimna loreyi]|uniref:Uncharacterized protein n=1 Tax=Mythimna loreyi TaxID=667449 RepID=A0ACC2R6D2_9NEOP|nr:hypothetical protein PYW08_014055 [Mythimna loreyi]
MEARKDSLSTIKLCRFCLAQGDSLTSIYEKRSTKNTINLSLKILSCVSVEVFPSDRRPTYICNRCKFFMELSYDFKNFCRQADEHILQFIQNATPMTPMSWPQSLLKIFRLANKAPEVSVMKTVIEGGTTVHVTQESDSDEEDDENVYNVKIGDGSDDGSKSARIKVITATDTDKGKPKRGKGNTEGIYETLQNSEPELDEQEKLKKAMKREVALDRRNYPYRCQYCSARFATAPKLARHVRTHNEEKSFPCKYCNKSFVKSHHLTRHLRLKHRENIRTCRGPFGETDQYRCEQCEDSFATQDELIYHSAIHATQNLICPLCQEKFEDVDAVTAHIKSHVNGTEFMCELCELVFTSKEKLECHLSVAHDDELRSVPDESSTEMDVDEDEEDSTINVKELDDHMVVEIKKTSDYLIPNAQEESLEKLENTNSEESDCEPALPDLQTALAIASKSTGKEPAQISIATVGGATITKTVTPPKKDEKSETQTASILRKAEEVKKKVIPQVASEPIAEKKTNNKMENNSAGTSDKSLRMLEKDLQELKRTHPRNDVAKTPAKPLETLRSRRAQIHTSTPKPRTPTDDRKMQIVSRSPIPEKKLPERRILTKENKEPKESKDAKTNNGNAKEDKIAKEKEAKEREAKEKEAKEREAKEKEAKEREAKEKEAKEKEAKEKEAKQVKEKETPKNIVKNGSDKINSEEGIRRSTRPSKIKDYAKMIRDRSQDSDEENDDSDDTDDEEYKEVEKPVETKARARRASIKTPAPKATPPKTTSSPGTPAPRKRGRPRKDAVAAKVRKEEIEDEEVDEESESEKEKPKTPVVAEKQKDNKNASEAAPEINKSAVEQKPQGTLVSPTGQTLKKIPIKALPPGVKPMPLPVNARPMGGELCEMQIGKKVVKVQKIVMTKAEVEAMAKKGLVEMKDGTMVLKQGIKIPTSDASVLKTSLVGEDKESPSNKKVAPTRCDFGEDA